MKKQIRQNVFETNSSSTHSISIAEGQETDLMDVIVPDADGVITLEGGEFGWQWERFNDALTKANYCALDVNSNEAKMEVLTRVLKEQTGAQEIVIASSQEYNSSNWSYIDHDSVGTSFEAFESEETLRRFIFNKSSWLYLGNDNGSPPNKFYDNPNMGYTDRLSIALGDKIMTWDFQKEPDEEALRDAIHRLLEGARFNKTKNGWEVDTYHWSGREVYFDFKYDSVIDTQEQTVQFKNTSLFVKAEKMCPEELKGDNWMKSDTRGESGYSWTKDKEKELSELPENHIKVKYNVSKL